MISDSDISLLLKHLQIPDLKFDLRPEWNSGNPNHRKEIHHQIKSLPFEWSASISHCGKAGGWVAVPAPYKIGFDIEEVSRVRPELARRICEEPDEEFTTAPSASSLWVAKEATFKGLFDINQPTVISQIEIGPWEVYDSLECFKLRFIEYQRTPEAYGVALQKNELKLGFFVLNSQLWSYETEKSNRD
ncbi:MAG: hypothetical protein AB7O96_05845 [Pseudobdellovibrionaceae bacterium]